MLGSLIVAAKCGDIGALYPGTTVWATQNGAAAQPGQDMGRGRWCSGRSASGPGSGCSSRRLCLTRAGRPAPLSGRSSMACMIGIAGLVGDLCESLIKRDLGKKDAAALHAGLRRPGRSHRQRGLRRSDRLSSVELLPLPPGAPDGRSR